MSIVLVRKKPVVVEAMQFDGTVENASEINEWCGGVIDIGVHEGQPSIAIATLEGTMRADVGDFIIRGMEGEFYPCKPSIFQRTYEFLV